ncbi:MAG: hypothetical protein KDC35_21580 [Acidobacteria bacterium]|nr:hypothetical protein [Acidobacteriota bacterium]
MNLEDRVAPTSFDDDEVVGFSGTAQDVDIDETPESDWVWIPETLFNRLILIGKAYDLHFASLIDWHEDSVLNSKQCEGFLAELEFIRRIVSDAALHEALDRILSAVVTVCRHNTFVLRVSPL